MERKTFSTALIGAPRLFIAEHLCVCVVLFFASFILLTLPVIEFWGVLLTALESDVSPIFVPVAWLAIVFLIFNLLRLPLTLFVWLVPARCPKCEGSAFGSWSANRYECEDCGHVEKTSFNIG